jgi:hypothetical protein
MPAICFGADASSGIECGTDAVGVVATGVSLGCRLRIARKEPAETPAVRGFDSIGGLL